MSTQPKLIIKTEHQEGEEGGASRAQTRSGSATLLSTREESPAEGSPGTQRRMFLRDAKLQLHRVDSEKSLSSLGSSGNRNSLRRKRRGTQECVLEEDGESKKSKGSASVTGVEDDDILEYGECATVEGEPLDITTTSERLSGEIVLLADKDEDTLPKIVPKRGRERPVTTGEYEKKEEKWTQKELEREQRKERDILDPLVKPVFTKSYKGFLRDIETKIEEFQHTPIVALEALVSEKATAIYKVATQSGSLAGTYVKLAKNAAAGICAAATVLAIKAQNPQEIPLESQMGVLRKQMQILRAENAELRRMIERLKGPVKKGVSSRSRSPLQDEDRLLFAEKDKRTRNWIRDSPPPTGGGGIPMDEPCLSIGTPPPSTGGGPSTTRGARGAPLPFVSGDAPRAPRREGEEKMEVESEEEVTAPAINLPKKEGREEKNKMEQLIAMIEGVCERIMDKRLGNPIPSYAEKKALEKAQREQSMSSHPSRTAIRNTTVPTKPPPKKGKSGRNPSSTTVTTLNPPARPGKPRIIAIETLAPRAPQPLAGQGGGKEMERKSKSGKGGGVPTNPVESSPPPVRSERTARITASTEDPTWSQVVSRKAAKKAKVPPSGTQPSTTTTTEDDSQKRRVPPNTGKTQKLEPSRPAKRREPRMAAVTITCPPGEYTAVMREARQKVNIEDIGIEGIKVRRAITGALIYEIPGERSHERADRLAQKLRDALSGREGVRVQRPSKTAELRVRGLDESVAPSEVKAAIATNGGCDQAEVSVGDIKMSPNGMGVIWARCPLKAANTLVQRVQIKVGWALARVELLEARPLQCYKCLEGGHVRARCPNKSDRSGKCYRCGQEGHASKECVAPVHCTVCSDRNLPSNHRTGGKACTPVRKGKRGIPLNQLTGSRRTAEEEEGPGAYRAPLKSARRADTAEEPEETRETPKEQRAPRERAKRTELRREEEEETTPSPPPQQQQGGSGKRQRLREDLTDDDPAAMEIAAGTTKVVDEPVRDGQ